MKLQNVKGTVDFLPEEQQIRNKVRKVCEETFELYGCKPLETPILNMYDLMSYKYGGGAEILKEVYRLTDQGERDLALRYDLTIPFAKVIGMNPDIRLPFKRYEIGKVFRNGPIKIGRYREFTQCDVDIVGIESVSAEAELMSMALEIFEKLELDVVISYNNRKFLVGLLEEMEVPKYQLEKVVLILDKLEKIGVEGVQKELLIAGIEPVVVESINNLLTRNESRNLMFYETNFSSLTLQEGIKELHELNEYLLALGVKESCEFNPFLARGLAIYTGTIYEVFLANGSITSSIGSGGRYDKIIGSFHEDGKSYPTVGISIGLDVVLTALQQQEYTVNPTVDVLLVPLGTKPTCLSIAKSLRKSGIRVEVEQTDRKLKRSLNYADKERIPYVIIVGESEVESGVVVVKTMYTKVETKVLIEDLNSFDFPIIF